MPVSSYIYNGFKLKQFNGNSIDLDTDVLKVALFTSTFTPDLTNTLYSQLSNEVANGSGYTTGGATLTTPVFSGTTEVVFDADDVYWVASSFTARYAVIYASVSGKLIGYIDFGQDYTATGGTFFLSWDASGILKITSS